jgi:CRP-like cAMP-binding protein
LIASSNTLGWQPFQEAILGTAVAETSVKLLVIRQDDFERTRQATPQLNYQLRKQIEQQSADSVSWTLSI